MEQFCFNGLRVASLQDILELTQFNRFYIEVFHYTQTHSSLEGTLKMQNVSSRIAPSGKLNDEDEIVCHDAYNKGQITHLTGVF